jgi:hypothetical protein
MSSDEICQEKKKETKNNTAIGRSIFRSFQNLSILRIFWAVISMPCETPSRIRLALAKDICVPQFSEMIGPSFKRRRLHQGCRRFFFVFFFGGVFGVECFWFEMPFLVSVQLGLLFRLAHAIMHYRTIMASHHQDPSRSERRERWQTGFRMSLIS